MNLLQFIAKAKALMKPWPNLCNECDEDELEQSIAKALQESFNEGMRHVSMPRNMVSVHGTDGCMNCETGRITIYAGSRYCIGCQHRMEQQK
jgi:hypothetical protein